MIVTWTGNYLATKGHRTFFLNGHFHIQYMKVHLYSFLNCRLSCALLIPVISRTLLLIANGMSFLFMLQTFFWNISNNHY